MTAPFLEGLAVGVLAFFEPCTIGTHTLFSAGVHALPPRRRMGPLLVMWALRALLAVVLIGLGSRLIPGTFGKGPLTAVLLAVLAAVYIVSRYAWIPVPHLEFFRGFPRGREWPPAVRLGLTLPACTIPLVLGLVGRATLFGSWSEGALSGMGFATGFSVPVAATAWIGLRPPIRRILSTAGRITPWITACLLLAGAVYVGFF